MSSRREEKTQHPGIYKRGNSFVVRVRDADGVMRRFAADDIPEALRIQGEQKKAARAGRKALKPRSKQSMYQYGKDVLDGYTGKTEGARKATVDEYVYLCDRFIKGTALGKRSISTVDVTHVRTWLKPLEAKYSPAYVRRILVVLRVIFRQALEERLLDVDPMATISSRAPKPDPDSKTLTTEQVQAIVNKLDNERSRLAALTIAFTGIRISEMVGLDRMDLKVKPNGSGVIEIRQRVRDGMKDAPKSERGKRSIPISKTLTTELVAYMAQCSWKDPDAPLFQSMRGGRLDARNWRSREFNVARAKAAAKEKDPDSKARVAKATPHMFRHSAARRWRKKDVDMEVISKLLGHSSPGFTLNTYGGVLDEDIPDADELGL